ncbi:MAG: hypothetical protein JNL40_02140 [Cyclobacteriaceae bacterium]|nr:hypothetical protein [Cyclobacteriaceae bacterium]
MMKLLNYTLISISVWLVLLLISSYAFTVWLNPIDWETAIGAVNSIVAALAFVGIIYTVQIQRKELKLQRKELKSTRREFQEQNITFKKQRFETTFFNLLNLHNSLTEKLTMPVGGRIQHGREAIRDAYGEFKVKYLEYLRINGAREFTWENLQKIRQLVISIFNSFFGEKEEYLGHYLRSIHGLLKFVSDTELIEDKEKRRYYDMIISHLNSYEVCLVYYYMSAGPGFTDRRMFDSAHLGARLNTGLLADVNHGLLFDPDEIIRAVLSIKNLPH